MDSEQNGGTNPTFLRVREAVSIVKSRRLAQGGEQWPGRAASGGSALGRKRAGDIFIQYVTSLAMALLEEFPLNLAAVPATEDNWRLSFVYETVERHTEYFAAFAGRSSADPATQRAPRRLKRPYDEMTVAFPPSARFIPPLMLVSALRDGPANVHLEALEVVVLHRKVPSSIQLPHAHPGKAHCGNTLNTAALVAHLRVCEESRCAVVGTRNLLASEPLFVSVPKAVRSLRSDLHAAARIIDDGRFAPELVLMPVVVGILPAGGPMGRGRHNQTNVEIVPGRMLDMVRSISLIARDPEGEDGPSPQPAALAFATRVTGPGPTQLATSALVPDAPGWPATPEGFAAALAAASGGASRPIESLDGPGTADWWYADAHLKAFQRRLPVRVLARRPRDSGAAALWVTPWPHLGPLAAAIETVMRSRESQRRETGLGTLSGSPYELWISRAYRHYAAGGLLLKGGATEPLRVGVTAAMTSAFLAFALSAGSLSGHDRPLRD
jgi:hypothetical protein